MNAGFWDYLQVLANTCKIIIDRSIGSEHHRFPGKKYPVNYGYLEGTSTIDGGGVDVWVGSLEQQGVVGILCSVDLLKRNTELKLLIDCSQPEIELIIDFINDGQMRAIYIPKPESRR